MPLALSTIAALLLANSGARNHYFELLEHPLLGLSLLHWVNDGLMAIFFYSVGLELKREILDGELRRLRNATLPIFAALGGMFAPALVYLLASGPETRGWPVPMATDIAFALGVLSLVGRRLPSSLRTLLLTLATVDDLGAIVVIALVFTRGLDFGGVALAAACFGAIGLSRRFRIRAWPWFILLGVGAWLGVLHSGVHATCAGVILGLMTPRRDDLIARLHPFVNRLVLPVFALANAGVPLNFEAVAGRVGAGVLLGLVLGKPLGITLASWLSVRFGVGALPAGVRWSQMVGVACLGGIGFTMAIFMAQLSLEGGTVDAAKATILIGSLVSAGLGALLLSRTSSSPPG